MNFGGKTFEKHNFDYEIILQAEYTTFRRSLFISCKIDLEKKLSGVIQESINSMNVLDYQKLSSLVDLL